jgi:HK97 gp10 family phage protein
MALEVSGMQELLKRMAQIEASAPEAVKKATLAGAKVSQEEIKKNTKDSRKDEIVIQEKSDGKGYTVATTKEYFEAHWEEFGTGAHDIVLKKKNPKVMANPEMIFGRDIHHPGTSPKPFFEPAFLQSKGDARKKIATVLKSELRLP